MEVKAEQLRIMEDRTNKPIMDDILGRSNVISQHMPVGNESKHGKHRGNVSQHYPNSFG